LTVAAKKTSRSEADAGAQNLPTRGREVCRPAVWPSPRGNQRALAWLGDFSPCRRSIREDLVNGVEHRESAGAAGNRCLDTHVGSGLNASYLASSEKHDNEGVASGVDD